MLSGLRGGKECVCVSLSESVCWKESKRQNRIFLSRHYISIWNENSVYIIYVIKHLQCFNILRKLKLLPSGTKANKTAWPTCDRTGTLPLTHTHTGTQKLPPNTVALCHRHACKHGGLFLSAFLIVPFGWMLKLISGCENDSLVLVFELLQKPLTWKWW